MAFKKGVKLLFLIVLLPALLGCNGHDSLFKEEFYRPDFSDAENEIINSFLFEAYPLDDEALDTLARKMSSADFVLLGESTHGTSEYYSLRAEISKRLIEDYGFSFIAVEGDWDSLYRVNQYVKHKRGGSAEDALRGIERWPLWMWRNYETAGLAEWMRDYNEGKRPEEMAGFYGMDVYDAERSFMALRAFFSENEINSKEADDFFECFYFAEESFHYYPGLSMEGHVCSEEAEGLVGYIEEELSGVLDDEVLFYVGQNAYVVKGAEKHFRIRSDPESWNSRVLHMFSTVERLSEHYGEGSKAIVWAHNTHVGDARFTPMGAAGSLNSGQLFRENYGSDAVFILGFGAYKGDVLAGRQWGAEMLEMEMPEAIDGSIEALLEKAGFKQGVFVFRDSPEKIERPIPHRAVGVVYNPEREAHGNYVPTIMQHRYDAFIFLRETGALGFIY